MLLVLLMVELTPLTETSIVQIVGYIVFLAHVLLFIRVKPPPHSLRDLMNILSLLEKLCLNILNLANLVKEKKTFQSIFWKIYIHVASIHSQKENISGMSA